MDDALEKMSIQLDQDGHEVWSNEQKESISFIPLVEIHPTDPPTYHSRPITKALELMDYKWDHFFEYANEELHSETSSTSGESKED